MLLFIFTRSLPVMRTVHFNTSHVTVYRGLADEPELGGEYFNTSHVTVYQERIKASYREGIFQYISCYCLSRLSRSGVSQSKIFQYISCYCLSIAFPVPHLACTDFNTSHVTVYRCEKTKRRRS